LNESFEFEVERRHALDAFNHPYVAPLVGVVPAPGRNLSEPRYAREAQTAFPRLAAAKPRRA
jgi:hypothetical protein